MKIISFLLLAAALLSPAWVAAHEGHNHMGGFVSPNKGTFVRVEDRVAELYLNAGKLNLCFYNLDGSLAKDDTRVTALELLISVKGSKPRTLSAAGTTSGCSVWDYSTKARRLTVNLKLKIDGKPRKAKLVYEVK